ncbi:hypothetical protein Pst134EB_028609 [Puccinia striiformis f. sp. tritici]|nr:hypothetical protein Pst134EB_028609 [Puccinia striiformis f. sp. tritici]
MRSSEPVKIKEFRRTDKDSSHHEIKKINSRSKVQGSSKEDPTGKSTNAARPQPTFGKAKAFSRSISDASHPFPPEFQETERVTHERLKSVNFGPPGWLTDEELKLLLYVIVLREKAIAFTERGEGNFEALIRTTL